LLENSSIFLKSGGGNRMAYRIGDYTLDLQTYTLRRGEEEVSVEPQAFGILACLIKHRDRVVTKDELITAVWDGRIISDATLSSRISLARQAVGDRGERQAIIRTVPRRGFRFVAEVSEDSGSDGQHRSVRRPVLPRATVSRPTAYSSPMLRMAVVPRS
jgi:DNA-binding winged helix-turn-helix (wHTH) protein